MNMTSCILCGSISHYLGVFIPAAGGRVTLYMLCADCMALPSSADLAEAMILEGRDAVVH